MCMNEMDFDRRLGELQSLRHELALAVMDCEAHAGLDSWGHEVWHAFKPYLGDGDVLVWGYEMELILLPALVEAERGDERFTLMLRHLVPIINRLKLMDPGPIYGCGRCS